MVLRLCWVCILYLGSLVLDTQVCACKCTGAQRWSKRVVKTRTLTVFRGHLNFDYGDIRADGPESTSGVGFSYCPSCRIWERQGEKTRPFTMDLLLQKHHYAPVSHLSKQTGLMSSRPARKDGRSIDFDKASSSIQPEERGILYPKCTSYMDYSAHHVSLLW